MGESSLVIPDDIGVLNAPVKEDDNGIGYLLDKQLSAWVQTGGILSNKISSLNTRIESSNKKISQLETQLEQKEAELKNKYATMQGTLNSLESQQTSISNWANSGNNNNR